jgi:hypothetical protein
MTLTHWGFDGACHTGRGLIVHRDATAPVRRRHALALRGPVPDPPDAPDRRLRRLGRPLDGRRQHVGLQLPPRRRLDELVDARLRPRDRHQPAREPDDLGGRTYPPNASPPRGRGVIRAGRRSSSARLARVGWVWGGRWTSPRDYQHFSASGG